MRLNGYLHVACMNHWQEVLVELVSAIVNSRLYERAARIYVSANGRPEHTDFVRAYVSYWKKFELAVSSEELSECEWPAIQEVFNRRYECDACFYLHTKGVSHDRNYYKDTWRRFMLYYMTARHEELLAGLAEHQVAGVAWFGNHFHGNFFYSTSDYIKILDNPSLWRDRRNVQLQTQLKVRYPWAYEWSADTLRLLCEVWIGHGNPRAFDLHPVVGSLESQAIHVP